MANEKDLSVIRLKKECSYDVNSEVTLEDYKTDVKRILYCKENVFAPSKYTSKDGIELEGTVCYRILYLGTDNRLYSTECTEEYTLNGKCDGEMAGEDVCDLTAVWSDGVTVRLLSPRKFSLKNKICSRSVLTSRHEKEDCVTEEFIPSECEFRASKALCATATTFGGDVLELCDEYIPRSDTERIICSDATVFISDVHSDDGKVSLRGELIVDVLACDDTGYEMPYVIRRKIPFTQETEHSDIRKGAKISASGSCSELKIQPEEARVLINAYCTVEYCVIATSEESICTDAFSPLHALKLTNNKIKYVGSAYSSNGNISISTSKPLSEIGVSPSSSVLTAVGVASVSDLSVNRESGKCAVWGECRFKVIFFDDAGEEAEYEAKEISVPFRYEFAYEADGEPSLYCSDASLSRTSVRSDGEKVALDSELSLAFTVASEIEKDVISDITVGEKKPAEDACIRIIYPQNGETLWSIAKKTSARISHICEANGICREDNAQDTTSVTSCRFVII